MPLYEYQCQDCGKIFELLRRFSEADKDVVCPECESENVERILSGFATGGCGSGSSRFT